MAKQKETPQTITLTNSKTGNTKTLDIGHATSVLKMMATRGFNQPSLYQLPDGWVFNGNDIVKA